MSRVSRGAAEVRITEGNRLARELFSLILIFWGLLLLLSLATWSPDDPGINQVVSHGYDVANAAGLVGAYLSGILIDFFGVGAFVFPAAFIFSGGRSFLRRAGMPWWRWTGLSLLTLCIVQWTSAPWALQNSYLHTVGGGGFIGRLLNGWSRYYLHPAGSELLWFFLTLTSAQVVAGLTWSSLAERFRNRFLDISLKYRERMARRAMRRPAPDVLPDPFAGEKEAAAEYAAAKAAGKAKAAADAEAVGETPAETQTKADSNGTGRLTGMVKSLFARRPKKEAAPKAEDDLALRLPFPPEEQSSRNEASEQEVPPEENFQASVAAFRGLGGLADEEESSAPETPVEPLIQQAADDSAAPPAEPKPEPPVVEVPGPEPSAAPAAAPIPAAATPETPAETAPAQPANIITLPFVDLLSIAEKKGSGTPKEILDMLAMRLTECFQDFNVKGEVQHITPGPVVTMFEFKPAPGIKVSKIAGLSDDLALALKAIAVRIEAPIPGTDVVGIEIPNEKRQIVYLREVLESDVFNKSKSLLTLSLGKDIAGGPQVADLAKMPHLLVAGATGAGKSVCINGILLSLLYKAKPDEVKLLLVDPKRIELSVYSDLPHLVHPVVTDMSLAKTALDWAVYEMDRRYESMARLGVRNIEGYNSKLKSFKGRPPEDLADLEPMPFLVIIIDELADLMLTAGKDAELSIVRLAQLARAAGIHMILATQRPSVDVVTGLIKANFPCRISFQVTSKHDSRTILDTVGAEHLLGKGDMLFKPSGGKLKRMHGAFVSDDDVFAVVDYWKKQSPTVDYDIDFDAWKPEGGSGDSGFSGETGGPGDMANDPMYMDALEFVMQQGKASISLIQRRFRIGYNRAARYVEQMEMDGVVGPADGSKPRTVIKNTE